MATTLKNMTFQDIITNIKFESISTSIKKYWFYQRMVDFINKIELSDHKYQSNGNIRYENYKWKFLFTMKDFMSFRTDFHSMYFMPTNLLEEKINGVHVPQFKIPYIINTTHPPHKCFG